ncbi:hypothetical protein NECAME_03823 [Necator americanus]|uniref:SSD domain-containing protein n=1 Tax=Necator americanus TaxID=51031 RepID=W2SZD5_NECAM|nr:hypothetical protein NECAME_03823 [Necator americanus]ETN75100.1 hypothetical protein NECAME_03823 [Necator americanus]
MYLSTLWLLLAFLLGLIPNSKARRASKGYDSSFVYLSARNIDTGKEVEVCANYLQYRLKRIAPNAESANPVGLSFWRNRFNETRICPLPSDSERSLRYNGTAVPLLYRIEDDGTPCTRRFTEGGSSFKNATQFQVDQLKLYGAANAILLVEKGKPFITRWHDYLFSDFYDPYVNASDAIETFFLYAHVFQTKILSLAEYSNISRLQLKFHRPPPYPIDLSMIVMWLLAVGCVTGGGVWAFVRHRVGKDKVTAVTTSSSCSPQPSSEDSNTDRRKKCIAFYSNFLAIAILMVILVGILMIGFFFRPILGELNNSSQHLFYCVIHCSFPQLFLVAFFNVMLVAFGSISVYGCAMALLSNCSISECCSKRLMVPSRKTEYFATDHIHFIFHTLFDMVFISTFTLCICSSRLHQYHSVSSYTEVSAVT